MNRIYKKKIKFLTAYILIVTGVLLVAFVYYFPTKIRPRIITVTQAYAKNAVAQIVDEEVKKVMLEELFGYDRIAVIERDENGRGSSVSSHTTMINRFTNDLDLALGERLDEYSVVENKVYLFSLLGSDLFTGIGPKIPIRFCPISVTNSEISHTFEQSGINQTLHTINLTVSVDMEILMPLAYSTVTVTSVMPLAQTLIVGIVPDAYVNRK